jgi:hypothetical protein
MAHSTCPQPTAPVRQHCPASPPPSALPLTLPRSPQGCRRFNRLAAPLGALLLLLSSPMPVLAQSAAPAGSPAAPSAPQAAASPLGAQPVLAVELARNVRPAFFGNDHTWIDPQPGEMRIDRSQPEQLQLIGTSGATWTLFLKSWVQTLKPAGQGADPVLVHESTRPAGPLASGQKWTARMVADQAPVNWCADTKGMVEGEFEVGPPQPYALKMQGQTTSVDVLPVVEKGRWSRCVSGKRYTRLLYAPALDAVVSVEFISYRPNGQPHESSFRFNVKEVR